MLPALALLVAAEKPLVVATVIFGEPDPTRRTEWIARADAAAQALSMTPKLLVISTGAKPAPLSLDGAKSHVERARNAFKTFRLAAAKTEVELATKALESSVGRPEARELDRQSLLLSASIANAQRDDPALTKALSAYALRFTDEPPPQEAGWPPTVRSKLDELLPKKRSTVSVRTAPTGRAFFDGRDAGDTPARIEGVVAGSHRLVIRAEAHVEVDRILEVTDPIELEESLLLDADALAATPPSPIVRASLIKLAAGLDALVLLDSKSRRVSRLDLSKGLAAGEATDAVFDDAPGGLETAVSRLFTELERPGGEIPWWAWTLLASGTAAVGAGTALRLSAVGTQDDLLVRAPALTQRQAFDMDDEARSLGTGGSVLIGVGAAAVAGFATWFLTERAF
ncbi:MAG: PEGA domain-containing protein [Deltaproteobacteria bacterium]|nr:PEGA domain-containing protein [Deltaproteobacteria bacterium]